jgi:phospholipid/cholesterol/gamma-HCH transport system permease protein
MSPTPPSSPSPHPLTRGGDPVAIRAERSGDALTISLEGCLDAASTGAIWRTAIEALEEARPRRLVIDASKLTYCDGTGVALLLELGARQTRSGGQVRIESLRTELRELLDLYGRLDLEGGSDETKTVVFTTVEQIGRLTAGRLRDLRMLVEFVGHLTVALLDAARHPSRIRWKDVALVMERAGVDALPILGLISFLMGLILAFQSAMPMREFGADIYVANLISVATIRELGPLMMAIVMAGRSSSAFAAELGTMKVKEELDALTTMGLEPVRFLVVPRTLGAVAMAPLLTLYANAASLIGGAVVMLGLGFSLPIYTNQVLEAADHVDLLGGLLKSFFFGIVVAAIGCLRGMETKTGASAVGESTTNAVVSGLVLIVLVDGVFAVVYYQLGI